MPSVQINGIQYPDVPSIVCPQVGGGSATFYDQTPWNAWMGLDTELVTEWYDEIKLSDTGMASWTPSSTATEIIAATTHHTFVANLEDNDYIVLYEWDVEINQLAGQTLKAVPVREYGVYPALVCRRPQNITSMQGGSVSYNAAVSISTAAYYEKYYNSSGTLTNGMTTGYGVYITAGNTIPTVSGSSPVSPTITVRTPSFSARCSSSYFATARDAYIDKANSFIRYHASVWKVDPRTSTLQRIYKEAQTIYNNPLMVLPSDYRQVNGLTMNGNTYYEIDGFRLQGSDTLRFSFSATAACNILGCYTASDAQTNYSMYATLTNGGQYMRYNGSVADSFITAGTVYNVKMTPTGATGMSTSPTWTAKTFTADSDMCIGTTSPEATSSKLVGTLYGAIQVDNRAKFVPCERIEDGVLGYYDVYGQQFYEPIGSAPTEYV